MTEYLKIGELKIVDGETLVKPDYYDDGLTFGHIFKDEEAYIKDWDAVCYVAEYAFLHEECDNDGFYNVSGFSHNELLAMCNGNREQCDYLFNECVWAYPETYLTEWEDEDYAYFYRFIRPGSKVWWNDPAGKTSGEYTVFDVPFVFNDHGEPVNLDDFALDAIIKITNGVSEAEVTTIELTPIYPK